VSLLTVEDPTPDEQRRLGAFLVEARKRGWCNDLAGIALVGRSELRLSAPVRETGPVLAGETAPKVGVLTVVRSVAGALSIDVDPATAVEEATGLDEKGLPVEPVAAVTVKKPTLCCPVPVEGPLVRSSQVLKTFCTQRQWKDWTDKGWLIAYGGITGHAYRIVHRHHPAARAQGKITWDLDDDAVIHCYDWTVPPAEEVLNIKLVLEHREPWIRNNSGALMQRRERFHNPLGHEGLDGTDSAAFVSGIGSAFQGAALVMSIAKPLLAMKSRHRPVPS
jgi:hypothetical protein